MPNRLLLLVFLMISSMVHANAAEKDFSQCFPLAMRAGQQEISWVCARIVSQIDLYGIRDNQDVLVERLRGQVVEDHTGNLGRWILVEGQSENYHVRIHWAVRENPIAQGVLRYQDGLEVPFSSRPARPQPPRSCRVGVPCH